MPTLVIDNRFRGPTHSSNGGYCCGSVAQFVRGAATVRLYVPPPLAKPLIIAEKDGVMRLTDGEQLIAEAKPTELDIEPPKAVSFETASVAAKSYRGFDQHFYPQCFVCGTERSHDDALCIFAGPIAENLVASPWRPHRNLCDSEGRVRDVFLWAALDCPGAYTFTPSNGNGILLGELATEIKQPIFADEACVVTGCYLAQERRKHFVATAIYNSRGQLAALAKGTWIEIPLQQLTYENDS